MIPQDTKTILDVGCGSGKMASELIAKDYLVDALSPPSIMTNIAKKRLSGKSDFYEMRFEELETDKRYDLVIFSESYQFVNLRDSFKQCRRYSKRYVLIADVFRRKMPENGPIGGGHCYEEFMALCREFNFKEVKIIDITSFIAPNFDLEADTLENFVKPVIDIFHRIFIQNGSFLSRAVVWLLLKLKRKPLKKLQKKYLTEANRNRHTFSQYKYYKFILLEVA